VATVANFRTDPDEHFGGELCWVFPCQIQDEMVTSALKMTETTPAKRADWNHLLCRQKRKNQFQKFYEPKQDSGEWQSMVATGCAYDHATAESFSNKNSLTITRCRS